MGALSPSGASRKPARRFALVAAALAAAFAPLACDADPAGVERSIDLVLRPVFSASAASVANAQLVDEVHVLIEDSEGVVRDTTIAWPLDQPTLVISITIGVQTGTTRELTYTLTALAGGTPLFSMTGSVTLDGSDAGTPAVVTDSLEYVGPGAGATTFVVQSPAATMLGADTLRLDAVVQDEDGSPLSTRIIWTTLDTLSATVDTTGLVRSRDVVGRTVVIAARPQYRNDLEDTVRIDLESAGTAFVPGPDSLFAFRDTLVLRATALGGAGVAVRGGRFSFSALDTTIATATAGSDSTVRVVAVRNGSARFVASGDGFVDTTTVHVRQKAASVVVTPQDTSFTAVGDTIQFSAVVRDSRAFTIAGAVVDWSSTAPATVAVNPSGQAWALQVGTARIVARSGTAADTVDVSANQAVASVTLDADTLELDAIDATATLVATGRDANGQVIGGLQFGWTSLTPGTATVSATGVVTAVANGEARVVASAGGEADTAVVIVAQRVATLVLTPAADTLDALGDTAFLSVAAADANGHAVAAPTVSWTCTPTGILTCDPAAPVGVATGDADVVAAADGVSDTAAIHVRQVVASFGVVEDTLLFTELNAKDTLTVTAADANGNAIPAPTVAWASRNDAVALVDAAGVVTAIGPGETWVDGASGGIADSAYVVVVTEPPEMDVVPSFVVIETGAQTTLSVLGYFGGDPVVVQGHTWSSAAAGVATVSSDGVVTGVAAGVAPIVADLFGELQDTGWVAVAGPTDLVSTAFADSVDAKLNPGQTFDVPVTLDMSRVSATGDLGSVQLELVFDPAVLRYDSATVHVNGSGTGTTNEPEIGTFAFAFAGTSAQGTADLTLVTVHFTVLEGAAEGTQTVLNLEHTARPSDTAFNEYALPISVDGRILVVNP